MQKSHTEIRRGLNPEPTYVAPILTTDQALLTILSEFKGMLVSMMGITSQMFVDRDGAGVELNISMRMLYPEIEIQRRLTDGEETSK